MKVLVVDDDDFSAQVLSGILRNLGVEIVRGRSGADGVRLLVDSGSSIQLVISDVYMPEMNGLELFRTIKRHPSLSKTPVVLMSGLADLNLVSQAAKLGCAHFLVKPVSREKVQAKLRELLPFQRFLLKEPKELLEELGIQTNQLLGLVERFHAQVLRLIEDFTHNNIRLDPSHSLKSLSEFSEVIGTDDLKDLLGKYANVKVATPAMIQDLEDVWQELDALREKIVYRAREEAAISILVAAEEKRRVRKSEEVNSEMISVAGRLVRREATRLPGKPSSLNSRMLSHELIDLAKAGDSQVQFDVALAYLRGYGTTINEAEGMAWLEKSAAQDFPPALVQLGLLKLQLNSVDNQEALEEAANYFNRAVEKGSAEANYWFDQLLADPSTLAYLQLARLGDPKAQFKLGVVYQESKEFEASFVEADFWLRLSSKQGYPEAFYRLGSMYLDEKADGVAQREAANYFRSAADLNHTEAQYSLGRMYNLALGVPLDINKAITWYERAARQGHVKSQFELAHIWETAASIKPDIRQALRWYLVCAASGYAPASKKVAELEKYLPPLDIQEAETLARATLEAIGKK